MTILEPDLKQLSRRLGGGAEVSMREADLLAYSYDGALDRGRPDAVALATHADGVRVVVAWCASQGIPFTARGAGTNLSGGCVPLKGGIILSLARMSYIAGIDTARGVAVVEPGTVNLRLQNELAGLGWFYAPDPSSFRVCTLGGNVAENSGGPRCLKYGTTTNHVLAVEAVMPTGEPVRFSIDDEGPDLTGLLVGAEGTLGVVTKIWLRILRNPRRIATLLAGFPSIEASMECVSEIIAAGILPRVLEALDKLTVESVEAYNHAGYPKTEAVLLIELDGSEAKAAREAEEVERICRRHGAAEIRRATDEAERERLWEGRRGAYAAVARIAPNVLVEDGVVPRGRLPEAYRRVRRIAEKERLRVGMLFHAGDGNLHPNIAFDERDAEETRRVKMAGFEMLRVCVDEGGSISGEHGIGVDKRAAMAWLFSPETLGLFRRIKNAFDPAGISNPDKVIPSAEEESAARELRPTPRPLFSAARALSERMRDAADRGVPVEIIGAGTRRPRSAERAGECLLLETRGLTSIVELDRSNYTIRVEAGCEPRALAAQLSAQGLYLPTPSVAGTMGGLLATKAWPEVRNHILGMRLLLVSGEIVELGGKVVKNVAGYDVAKVLLGSWGAFAVILDVTFKLYAAPLDTPSELPVPRPFAPNSWHRKLKSAFDPDNRLNPWVFGGAS